MTERLTDEPKRDLPLDQRSETDEPLLKEPKRDLPLDQRVMVELEVHYNVADIDKEDGRKYDDCEGFKNEKIRYVNVEDEEEAEEICFSNLGGKYCSDYTDCHRNCQVRVLYDGNVIGSILLSIINRDLLGGLNIFEPCDAQSAEMCSIAEAFFKPDGELRGALQKRCTGHMANIGCFMYIKEIKLDPPYNREADETNMLVAAEAIGKLVNSAVFDTEEMNVTLAMYLPDGRYNNGMRYDKSLLELDARQFKQAGFDVIRTRECSYFYFEKFPIYDDDDDNDDDDDDDNDDNDDNGDASDDASDDDDDDDNGDGSDDDDDG